MGVDGDGADLDFVVDVVAGGAAGVADEADDLAADAAQWRPDMWP